MYEKQAVLIGAGKIGRGYVAYMFRQAGYKMTFLEYSEPLVKKLRDQGYYTVFMQYRSGDGRLEKQIVRDYQAYCTETEYDQCVDALVHTNYATVHLFPGAINGVARLLAGAVKKKLKEKSTEPLNIIFVINFLDADTTFREATLKQLDTDEEKAYMDQYVGFVYGLVRGGGYTPTPEQLEEDELAISCMDEDYLPVDKDQLKGPFPAGVNFIPATAVGALVKKKVWGGNVSHCCQAFFGKQKGYTYSYQSQQDKYIMKCAHFCSREANIALLKNVKFDMDDLRKYFHDDKEQPFDASKVDTITKDMLNRIGADPIRKLSRTDRFTGPALLCLKSGIMPNFLARGAAMGFYFSNPEDKAACEIQEFIRERGIGKAIEKYCELNLSDKEENAYYQMVLANYYEIGSVGLGEIAAYEAALGFTACP